MSKKHEPRFRATRHALWLSACALAVGAGCRGTDANLSPDAGTDGGSNDAGQRDAGPPDGGQTDAGPTDAGAALCATRTGMRGLTSRSLTVAGLKRTYLVYLPASLSATAKAPFVYVFHGYLMSGQEMHDITQYSRLADSAGVAVVFPDGEGGPDSLTAPWNVANPGQTVCGAGQSVIASGDDFAFIDAIKADVSQDQCLDATHVFATGFSMGGYFAHHIGCYRGDFRAIAPHSGGTLADLSVCTTGHVPVIIFHGTSDSVISDACDDPTATPEPGFPASATLWAAKNGCQSTYSVLPQDGTGGGQGQCLLYDGCPADGQVVVCTFAAMNHCWAGGDATGAGGAAACPSYADATFLQWNFFKKYAW